MDENELDRMKELAEKVEQKSDDELAAMFGQEKGFALLLADSLKRISDRLYSVA